MDELVVELNRKGCANPKGNKEKIEDIYRAYSISLKKRSGRSNMVGIQPKGALQLLYEHVFIDPAFPNPEKVLHNERKKERRRVNRFKHIIDLFT